MKAWVLIEEGTDYTDADQILGVYEDMEQAVRARVDWVQQAILDHPSNRALENAHCVLTLWDGSQEIEIWVSPSVRAPWVCTHRTITVQAAS